MSHCFSVFCRDVRSRPVHPTHLTTPLISGFDQAQNLEVALALICIRREFSNTQINFITFHYSLEGSLDINKYICMKTWLH